MGEERHYTHIEKTSDLDRAELAGIGKQIVKNNRIYNSQDEEISDFKKWAADAGKALGPFETAIAATPISPFGAPVQNMKKQVSLLGHCLNDSRPKGEFSMGCLDRFIEHTIKVWEEKHPSSK